MLMFLSENSTIVDGRDLGELGRWARVAEDAGFDAVMIREHIVLGPDASAHGVMGNPRDHALPGAADPPRKAYQFEDIRLEPGRTGRTGRAYITVTESAPLDFGAGWWVGVHNAKGSAQNPTRGPRA
jgi:hypothetical protein